MAPKATPVPPVEKDNDVDEDDDDEDEPIVQDCHLPTCTDFSRETCREAEC